MPGGLGPSELAKAYRDENPGFFDDLDDRELIEAIKAEDPETYRLLDPLLEGAHLLLGRQAITPPPAPPRLTPPAPQPTTLDTAIGTGLRVVPAVAGSIAGSALGPLGTAGGGFGGGVIGEGLGQAYERWTGLREGFDPRLAAVEGAINAFPVGRAATTAGRIGMGLGQGALAGGTSAGMRTLLEQERVPTLGDIAPGMVFGAGFGGGTAGVFEGVNSMARAAGRGLGVEGMGGFGDVGTAPPGPPPPGLSAAVDALYQQEETILAQKLVGLYGPEAARPSGASDYHTALQAKDYLQQMADLKQTPIPVPPIQPGLTPPPPPPPGPFLLPETAGPGGRGLPPGTIRAYPPGVNPTIEVVGSPPPRIIGGTPADTVELNGPPPTPILDEELEKALAMAPGPPQLILQGQRVPPPPRLPGQPPLISLPTVNTATRQRSPSAPAPSRGHRRAGSQPRPHG